MRINEILTENIFSCDYHQVMRAVAELYSQHYDVNIWEDADTHDSAAQALMKARPSPEQLEWIVDTGSLPEGLEDVDFPVSEKLMLGMGSEDLDERASRDLCTSGKTDSALGASNLASCKSQGYRSREGGKSHKIGGERQKVRGKKIKGKKYGGPLPDWS
jgi:hypothetical protein